MNKDFIEIKIVKGSLIVPFKIHIDFYNFIKSKIGGEFTRLDEKEFYDFFNRFYVADCFKKKDNYTRIVLARVVEKQFSLKTIEVTTDFANFLVSEYKAQFGKHCAAYSSCWFNDMILKYAAVCGIYRIPKNIKSCD